jgi:hypothetical protein
VALLTAVTATTFALLVPPFESPDEAAHAEYVRYVALHGLPRSVPPPGDASRALTYEWVQPPLYYLATAPLAWATDASAPAAPVPDPRSRLTGGTRWTLYLHDGPLSPSWVATRFYLLRGLGVLLTIACVLAVASTTYLQTASSRAALFAGAAVALVPQWTAVMASIGNDGLATTLATLATLAILRLPGHPTVPGAVAAAALTGAALSTKLTTACLVPGLLVAVWQGAGERRGALALWSGVTLVLTGGWPLAWNLFAHGDPWASDFKRAALDAGGFYGPLPPVPRLLDTSFWPYFVERVIEPFWARFGSLGAGLSNDSPWWWAYFGLTGAVAVALLAGGIAAWQPGSAPDDDEHAPGRRRLARTLVLIVSIGLALWVGANVVNPASMVVHWTPRHVMPLTAPLVALAAFGAQRLTRRVPPVAKAALGVAVLGLMAAVWVVVVGEVSAAFR